MKTIYETKEMLYAIKNEISIISLKAGAYNIITNLDAKEKLLNLFVEIDQSDKIKGMILINTDEYPGNEKYQNFLQDIMQDNSNNLREHSINMARAKHSLEQLTLQTIRFSKPMIAGLQGRITGEFFGQVLPYDFRFATDDTVLTFPSVSLGFPPSGVLAFYLNRYVGPAKATEILLLDHNLSANDAHRLGLLTEVTKKEDLLDRCLETMEKISQLPLPSLQATRRLLHPEAIEIEEYLDEAFNISWKSLSMQDKVERGLYR